MRQGGGRTDERADSWAWNARLRWLEVDEGVMRAWRPGSCFPAWSPTPRALVGNDKEEGGRLWGEPRAHKDSLCLARTSARARLPACLL